ncbi:MAG: hypothetical protein RJB66_752 [Pseudomonadota bacterium]|jgi:uncharacterized protein (TIGR00251 family)
MGWIRSDKKGCIIDVHAQPQARKNEVVGLHNDRLKVKIKSPPVDGKANECLTEFVAELLNLNRSAVELIKGETSRQKQLLIHGMSPETAEALLFKRTTS